MGFSATQFSVCALYMIMNPLQVGFFVVLSCLWSPVSSFGSMSSIATSFGDKGSAFCSLKPDGSHAVSCIGSNHAIIHGTPRHFRFLGLTGGDDFVCGIVMSSGQPYCWGNSIHVRKGVPQPMVEGAKYLEISAGDNHVCGLRKPLRLRGRRQKRNTSLVDCWGYNMTVSYVFDGPIQSLSAGCGFNCCLFSGNRTAFCWGNDMNSLTIRLIPRGVRFKKIAAGGNHVCGIREGVNSRTVCWGRSIDVPRILLPNPGQDLGNNISLPPNDPMVSVVGGRFHACGIKSYDLGVLCWGHIERKGTPIPRGIKIIEASAGDYFTCGILAAPSHGLICWGIASPDSLPVPVSPGLCRSTPCPQDYYEVDKDKGFCNSSNSRFCMPCSGLCPDEMYETSGCNSASDRLCAYNCSACLSPECVSNCSSRYSGAATGDKDKGFWSLHMRIAIAEVAFAVCLVIILSIMTVLYLRYRLRGCQCSATRPKEKKLNGNSAVQKENGKIRPDNEEFKIRKAKKFTYEELEMATDGFKEESIVGKGSFSCVFKGVLKDGTVVAVKRAIRSSNSQDSNEFHTELDLISRLNHAHLLNLLGYCEEGGEIILVYEFMAHGSLYQHLHSENNELREKLDWVKRVTIAVQAARGIEYLHGYACPPVIHRDIKSSNILIDEEHNARVADFGLSLLGPADSSTPLSELPAGTLGYLDPEYYRLHNLTTKSDVYSFGVLLLELLSGRKAIEPQYDEGENIVQWAKPLVRSGDIDAVLDPVLTPPTDDSALRRIAIVACKCARMKGNDRPSMDKVTTALEQALAQLMGSPCSEQPILPTEVVLGSSRLHMRSSQRSSNRSSSETAIVAENEDQMNELRAPSWITFPSVASSSQRMVKSTSSEAEVADALKNIGNVGSGGEVLRSLEEEEIGPASPQERLFLHHNF